MTKHNITTEAEALADILLWSGQRPGWQRDALRRLVVEEELTAQDVEDLTALCKDPDLPTEPLSKDHLAAPDAGLPPVQLRSIHGVQNVNALAEGQRLNFIPAGVTVVYGDNGSGKSGYVRILKSACRARGRSLPILKNIYTASPGPQLAEMNFTAGGQDQSTQWRAEEVSNPLLAGISVFDSRTANVHVDETNDVAYTPYPMKLLERLVQACRLVKSRIDEEVRQIAVQTPHALETPACSPDTEVGRLISSLSETTSAERVEELAALAEDEEGRLATLAADFAHGARATATRLQAQSRRLAALVSTIENLSELASDASAERLRVLIEEHEAKTQAARLAATREFGDDLLPGVGSAAWRALWEAARAFSVEAPYPKRPFPVIGDGARCVLCHQALAPEATERLQHFEAFVQDRTQQEEVKAREAVTAMRAEMLRRSPPIGALRAAVNFLRDDLGAPALAEQVRGFGIGAKSRLRGILSNSVVPEVAMPASPADALREAGRHLADRVQALLADEASPERRALKNELRELTDRQWLAGIKDDVIAEIGRKEQIARLQSALRETRQNEITQKSSSLSETLVTDKLRGRFAQEIDHLDLAGLAVELRKERSEHGVPLFRVTLMHKPDQKAGNILSEGEHRCVALAAFMAELSTTDNHSGIVFDDPVSSLDHLHREAIARRLADEGRNRQVIVFTHDLPFLFLLERACKAPPEGQQPTEVALRHVCKRGDQPGICENTPPMKAKSAQSRAASLQNHLDNTRVQYSRDPEMMWLTSAKGILVQVREAWESAVEEVIAPVLRTFHSKVDTKGFAKLSAITLNDAETMRAAYGRCSVLLHNASDALNPSVPTPMQVEEEITSLREWIVAVQTRQDEIRAR